MEEEEHSKAINWVFIYFGAGIVMIAGFMALWDMVLRFWFGFDYEKRANFGDEFGPLGVILSGAALFGLILSILLQRKDLRAQTHALELQQKALLQQIEEFAEQKEELRRSAAAQETANRMASAQLEMQALTQELNLATLHAQHAAKIYKDYSASPSMRHCEHLVSQMKRLVSEHQNHTTKDESPDNASVVVAPVAQSLATADA